MRSVNDVNNPTDDEKEVSMHERLEKRMNNCNKSYL